MTIFAGESAGTKYSDPKVCKSFLLACCPHDILAATNSSLILQRMDLGECPRIHDLALRADFEAAQKLQDHFYDVDACDHLASFISDCDRKTEQAKKKLAETQEALSDEVTGKANSVHDFAESIEKKLAAAELLGAEGDVEGSIKHKGSRRRSRSRSRGHRRRRSRSRSRGHRRHKRSRSRGERRRRSRSGSREVKKERPEMRESRDSEDFAINSIPAEQN